MLQAAINGFSRCAGVPVPFRSLLEATVYGSRAINQYLAAGNGHFAKSALQPGDGDAFDEVPLKEGE